MGSASSRATGRSTRASLRITSPDAVAKLGGPAAVTFDPIEGGNHEQMGWYTGQPNDPPATISREAQQERIVASTRGLLDELAAGVP